MKVISIPGEEDEAYFTDYSAMDIRYAGDVGNGHYVLMVVSQVWYPGDLPPVANPQVSKLRVAIFPEW